MRRKNIDIRDWERIEKIKDVVYKKSEDIFKGYVCVSLIEKVYEKFVCNLGERQFCLIDDGYTWIRHQPLQKNWVLSTMLDDKKNIIEWYFDITKENSVDEDGCPYYDDLYLDVVVLPSGEIVLLDEDELEDALNRGEITKDEFALAYSTANEIMNSMAKDVQGLIDLGKKDLEFFEAQLGENKINY